MIKSGVATPRVASNNIAVVITTAATNPASNPAEIAFALLTMLPILLRRFWATSVVASAVLSGFCWGAKRSCAEDNARYSFAAARIFRARSTTMADVTCFMQA
jgi:hypothetical protein